MSVLQTGNKISAMSTWRTKAADRAIMYVGPNIDRAPVRLSFRV